MTVSERLRLVVQYLMVVADDGPDFSVGSSKLSDYISFEEDAPDLVVRGIEVGGQRYQMSPLLGVQAQTLESLCQGRGDWLIACLASQVILEGSTPDWSSMTDVNLIAWHKDRIAAVKALPESQFEELMGAFLIGQEKLRQFVKLSISDDGIVCMPNNPVVEVPPARFRSSSCIGKLTRSLFENPHRR